MPVPLTPYGNRSGASGVRAYRIGARVISVQFADGAVYDYSYASTGRSKVEQMKILARAGAGLSTFISQQVRDAYAVRHDPP